VEAETHAQESDNWKKKAELEKREGIEGTYCLTMRVISKSSN